MRTSDGIVGYGEAHHALAPTVVADLVNQSLAPLVVGQDALAVEHIWETMYYASFLVLVAPECGTTAT